LQILTAVERCGTPSAVKKSYPLLNLPHFSPSTISATATKESNMQKLIIAFSLLLTVNLATAQVQRVKKVKAATDSTTLTTSPEATPAPQAKANKQSRREMIKELGLSREQKVKFRDMQQSNKAKKEAIESDDKLSDTEKKQKLKALKVEQLKATMAILNDEQKEKLKKMRQDKMEEDPTMEEQ
jgi:hypothetical protein